MRVAVTGASGFMGKNLGVRLNELGIGLVAFGRGTTAADVERGLATVEAVVHLAGVNWPADAAEFEPGNAGVTRALCAALARDGRAVPVIFASSVKAVEATPFGQSKAGAEQALLRHAKASGAKVAIYRLPNVFGKWCRPNDNSAVATFCNTAAAGLPLTIHDASEPLRLVYIDDVLDAFLKALREPGWTTGFMDVAPVHATTVGAVALIIAGFRSKHAANAVADVGAGLERALYATYVSYLTPEAFAYPLAGHEDARGFFAEFVKTPSAGQVSVFSANPGVTRGGHYHHTKTEKFLVVAGEARFRFRHILTGARHEITTSGNVPTVVETVPGWAHDVTNIGSGPMHCCLWANELFDPAHPDTIAHEV